MSFHCTSLVFIDPDTIAGGIEEFFKEVPNLKEVHSVTVFTTAVQRAPARSLHISGNQQQPEIQYQFRFVITYSV